MQTYRLINETKVLQIFIAKYDARWMISFTIINCTTYILHKVKKIQRTNSASELVRPINNYIQRFSELVLTYKWTCNTANAIGQLGTAPSRFAMHHPYLGRANQVLITHTTPNELFVWWSLCIDQLQFWLYNIKVKTST